MKRPRLMIADDHELLLDGLRKLLVPDFDLVATATDGQTALTLFEQHLPDLLLLDVSLPLLNGMEVARQLRARFADARILFVTMQKDKNYVTQAFRCGACGYLLKEAAGRELIQAIQAVLEGQCYVSPQLTQKARLSPFGAAQKPAALFADTLTRRQQEVLRLIAEGKSMKEMAHELGVSVRTVEFHKKRLVEELGISSTAELTLYYDKTANAKLEI